MQIEEIPGGMVNGSLEQVELLWLEDSYAFGVS